VHSGFKFYQPQNLHILSNHLLDMFKALQLVIFTATVIVLEMCTEGLHFK